MVARLANDSTFYTVDEAKLKRYNVILELELWSAASPREWRDISKDSQSPSSCFYVTELSARHRAHATCIPFGLISSARAAPVPPSSDWQCAAQRGTARHSAAQHGTARQGTAWRNLLLFKQRELKG